jgi:hypothetical protein
VVVAGVAQGYVPGAKYIFFLVHVTAFQLITGGALQKIGEFDNQAEASAAAGIPGQQQKNGKTVCHVVQHQLQAPTKKPSKPTASSSRGSYCFIYTFQLEDAITDVDIKAKLALRGTAAARKELKDWRRSQAGTWSCRTKLKDSAPRIQQSTVLGPKPAKLI